MYLPTSIRILIGCELIYLNKAHFSIDFPFIELFLHAFTPAEVLSPKFRSFVLPTSHYCGTTVGRALLATISEAAREPFDDIWPMNVLPAESQPNAISLASHPKVDELSQWVGEWKV